MPKTAKRPASRATAAGIARAIAHPLRTDILTVLHDGIANGAQLSRTLGVPWGNLSYHVRALLEANAIEVARKERVGAHHIVFYRQLTTSTYTVEDLAELSPEQRHAFFRIVNQSIPAEALAALRAGHFGDDPRVSAAWDRVSLDEEGFSDLASSCTDFIDRLYAIAAEASQRLQRTGELPKVYVGAVYGFKRSRIEPATSAAVGEIGGGHFAGPANPDARDGAADVGKAIAHLARTDILTVLHDGPASKSVLSRETGMPIGALGHHIQALLDVEAIKESYSEEVGNHDVTFYEALTTSTYTVEDLAELSPEQRHAFFRIVNQSIAAEALAALGSGHFADDPRVSAAWDRVSLDEEGFSDLASSCTDFMDRLYAIAAEAEVRVQVTGELPKAYVGAVLGFRRSRTKPATSTAVGSFGA